VIEKLEAEFCDWIPEELKEGVLYVCRNCAVTAHLCPCGCGDRAIVTIQTDWQPSGWFFDEATISFSPSILNPVCPKKAHYYLKNGQVQWCEVPR
jgi:hypothetical protein